MAEQIRTDRISTLPDFGTTSSIEELDAIKTFGVIYAYNGVGLGGEGNVFCLPFAMKEAAIQIFVHYTGSPRKIRTYNWSDKVWTNWENL